MNGTDRAKLCYANSVRVFCFFLLFGVEIGFSWSTLIYFALRKVREREREPSEKARRIHFQMQPNIAGLACPSLSYMARRRSPQPLRLAGRWRLAARMNKTTKLDSSVRFVVCCCQQIKRFHLSTPDDNRVKTGINLLTWRELRCYSSRDQEEENKHPHTDRHLLCLNR